MKSFLFFMVFMTFNCLINARPREKITEYQTKKIEYVGCAFPYQFVNPYYHVLTARSCANLLLDRNYLPALSHDEYRFGCDCIDGFAMNYQGYCIDESKCTILEAFGALVDEGKIVIPSKEHQDQIVLAFGHSKKVANGEKDAQNPQSIQKLFKDYANIPEPNDVETNDRNSVLNSNEMNNQNEDEDCDEEDCHDYDDGALEKNHESTEKQTTNLISTEISTSPTASKILDKVDAKTKVIGQKDHKLSNSNSI